MTAARAEDTSHAGSRARLARRTSLSSAATICRRSGSLARAKQEYEKALKIYPRHLDALYNLAIICERLGQKGEAIDDYKRYLEIKETIRTRGRSWDCCTTRRQQGARRVTPTRRRLEVDPKFGRAHHNLGVLLKEQGDLKGAEQHLGEIREARRGGRAADGDAYYSLGILYLQELRDKEAKAAMQKAIDIDPSVPYYNNAMGDIYLFEKRPDLSIVYYQKAIEKDPKYALAYSGLGDAYAQMKDRDKAPGSLSQGVGTAPRLWPGVLQDSVFFTRTTIRRRR